MNWNGERKMTELYRNLTYTISTKDEGKETIDYYYEVGNPLVGSNVDAIEIRYYDVTTDENGSKTECKDVIRLSYDEAMKLVYSINQYFGEE